MSETVPDNDGCALSREQIAELLGKLAAWETDWNDPGMSAYDKP